MEKLIRWGGTLTGILGYVWQAIRDGEPERVADILPDTLLTDLELRRAELEARARFSARDEALKDREQAP
jgi:uncharacterized membrane protein